MKVLNISTQYSNPSFYITPEYLKSFNIDYNPTSLLVEAYNSTGVDLKGKTEEEVTCLKEKASRS